MMVSGRVIRPTAFRILLVALGMVALGACRSTPKPADAAAPAKPAATEKVDEAAKPEKKPKAGLFAGFRWPWQKKRPAAAELEGKTQPPPRDEGPPPPPVPDSGPIAPRAPEPGLAPADAPAPREPKPDDPLSGIGLHPGT